MGVLEAAELRALAWVRPRAIGVEEDAVRPARDQVDLPVELRDPEAVDDVRRRADHVDTRVRRDVQLVRGDGVTAGIADLPEPLMARHVHGHRGRARIRRRRGADHEDVRPDEERREQHERRRDSEPDDQSRRGPLAAAERQCGPVAADPAEQQEHGDHREPDRRADEHHPAEVRDPVFRRAVRVEDVLAAGERDDPEDASRHQLRHSERPRGANPGILRRVAGSTLGRRMLLAAGVALIVAAHVSPLADWGEHRSFAASTGADNAKKDRPVF